MSAQQPNNVAYGLTQPLITESPFPIASRRDPRVNDFAVVGTIWSNVLTNTIYILASIAHNSANWISIGGGGAGMFASLTVTPGPTDITGLTNINTAGAGITNIGRGGTGIVNIGNAASGVTILGDLTANGGEIDLNSIGANLTNIGILPGTGAVHIGNTTGNTFIDSGDLVVSTGNITIVDAFSGYVTPTGCVLLSGAGDPNGVVGFTAPIGSLYLNSTPTGVTDRLFVNTNGGTTWTFFTSNA